MSSIAKLKEDQLLAEEAAREAAPVVASIRAASMTIPREAMGASLLLASTTGAIAAFRLNMESNRVAMLKAFAEIQTSKAYRNCTIRRADTGELVTVQTW